RLAHVPAESAGASSGPHGLGQFFRHGHAHLPHLAAVQPAAARDEHRCGKYRHDRLDDLITRSRVKGSYERKLSHTEFRCRVRYGSDVHMTMLPPVATH